MPVTHPAATDRRSAFAAAPLRLALAIGLAASLSGCIGGAPTNRQLESIHQPVVERTSYTIDLASGPGGLLPAEAGRLSGWFEAMNLRYGDRIAVDDPLASAATRASIENVAGHFGLLVNAETPVTPGYVNAGSVRVILTRTAASVPHCPDWSANSETNWSNATSSNYGCAVNTNLAVMVANPEDLLHGAHSASATVVMSADKAIASYRAAKPTGENGLKTNSSTSGAK